MKGTLDIHRELLARDVAHEVIRLPKVVLTADELPETLGLDASRCLAVRMYQADEDLVAVIVRSGELPDPARLLNLLGARSIRAAAPDLVHSVTDFAAGLVPPLLLPSPVILVCDAAIASEPVVYVPTGESGTAIGLQSHDLLATCGATVAELCYSDEEVVSLGEVEDALADPHYALRLEDLPAHAPQPSGRRA